MQKNRLNFVKKSIAALLAAVMAVTNLSIDGSMEQVNAAGEIHVYAETPGDTVSEKYTLTANGTQVPVVSYRANGNNFDIARFASQDAAPEYTVTVAEDIQTVTVYPERYYPKETITISEDKRSLTFRMSEKLRYAFVMVNGGPADQKGKPYLAIINDPPETDKPDVNAPNVLNAKIFMEQYLKEHPNAQAQEAEPAGTTSGGTAYEAGQLVENSAEQVRFPNKRKMTEDDVTYALSAALDEIYKEGSAYDTLYFPAGTYICSGLEIRNRKGKDVTIYLEEGALIKNRIQECMQAMEPAIGIWDSERITISGRGVFDGNGVANYKKDRHDAKDSCHQGGVMIVRSSHITFNDTYVRDAKQWNWESHGSKHCTLNNIKGLTPYNQPWVDGLDMASAQDLIINGALTLGNDDCFASGHYNPSDGFSDAVPGFDHYNKDALEWDTEDSFHVSVSNTLGWSFGGGNGLRMGHNTYGHLMKDYSFDNVNSVNFLGGDRGITVQNGTSNKHPYPEYENISIKNSSFDTTRVSHNATIFGLEGNGIGQVTLENCWFSKQSADFQFDNINSLAVKDLYAGGNLVKYYSQITSDFEANLAKGSIGSLIFTAGEEPVIANRLPVFTHPLDTVSAYAGQPLVFFVKADDPDLGDAVIFGDADVSQAEGAVFDKETGKFSWIPTEEQAGTSYKVIFTASDYTNQAVSHEVTLKVGSAKDNKERYTVLEDAHVQSYNDEKEQNFGSTIYLTVNKADGGLLGQDGTPSDGKLALLKFDLSGMREKKGQFDQAELSLTYITFRKEEDKGKKAALQAAVVENAKWNETELTWNNKPAFSAEESAVRKSQEYELGTEWEKGKNDKPKKDFPINGSPVNIEITDFINTALDSNAEELTLAVNDSAGLEHYFVSKEGALGTDGNGAGKYDKASSDMAPAIVLNLPQQPAVKGPETMSLQEGYTAAQTDSFAVLGFENPTVELSGNTGNGIIAWDDAAHQLKIAEGLAKGEYTVTITATEGEKTGTCNFTLTVTDDVKAGLRELYLAKKELLPGAYTSASWTGFQSALAVAENVLKKENTTAEQAKEAADRLSAAEEGLITLESVRQGALEAYKIEESNKDSYTAESWSAYQTAYQALQNLQSGYTEEQLNTAVESLQNAHQQLEGQEKPDPEPSPDPDPEPSPGPEPEPNPNPNPIPEEIKAAVAQAVKAYAVADSEKEKYTEESWNAYQKAYQALLDLQSKDNYTPEEANQAVEALKKAHQALVKREESAGQEELKSALAQAVKNYSVSDTEKGNYTEESWNAYQIACQALIDLQKKGNYTEAEVTQAIEALKKAYQGLQKADTQARSQIKVNKITLNGTVKKLAKGKTVQLEAAVVPANAEDKSLEWTSSNEAAASVDKNGLVTAQGKGSAMITASAKDGSGISGTYQITVVNHAVKKVLIKSDSKKMAAGKKIALKASVSATGKDANKVLNWTTSNKKYAAVSQKGIVTAKKAGIGKTVTITARATDGSGKKSSIRIKIVKHAVKKITIKSGTKTLKAGKKITLKASVKTTGKTANKTLKWTASNKKYATVTAKGVVTAKKAGKGRTVTIRAMSTDGTNQKASIKIKIR